VLKSLYIALGCLISTAPLAEIHTLPDLGSPGLVVYDRQTEIQLGREFTKALHSQHNLVQDPIVLSYIRRLGHRIAEFSNDQREYTFYVIDNPSINAFAGPNGIIGIHTGLIMAAETEDELASVIAHEIAHVSQQHLSRRFEQQDNLNITSFASLLAAILIGTYNPTAGIAAVMGSTGLSLQQQLKYSRIHEHEADHHGIKLLSQAGYDPHAMASFFGKLAQQHQLYEFRPPEILMTHPVTENRLAQASNRAHQFVHNTGLSQAKPDPLELELIKLHLNPSTKPTTKQPIPNCYLNLDTTHSKEALGCLEMLKHQYSNNRLIQIRYAEQLEKTDPDAAKRHWKALTSLYPQDESVLLLAAKFLMTIGEDNLAASNLIQQSERVRYKQDIYFMLAQIYNKQNLLAEAYLFEAIAFLELGEVERSKHMLKQSLESRSKIIPQLEKLQRATQLRLENIKKHKVKSDS
jgi:predicted Zn-dependent protease